MDKFLSLPTAGGVFVGLALFFLVLYFMGVRMGKSTTSAENTSTTGTAAE